MTADESDCDAPFRDPLPIGYCRRVLRVAPGLELNLERGCLRDALVVVAEGEAELECPAGTSARFGRGSMIPIARLRIARVSSVGLGPLVLVAVSRASVRGTDEFPRGPGSHSDC